MTESDVIFTNLEIIRAMTVFKNASIVAELCDQYELDKNRAFFITVGTDIFDDTPHAYALSDVKYLKKHQIKLGKFRILIGKESVQTLTLRGDSADIQRDFELEFMRLCFG
jgi:hypothetical protein